MKMLEQILTTLLLNGFHLSSVNRLDSNNSIINAVKYDKIGAEIKYSFLLSASNYCDRFLDSLEITSNALKSTPIVICEKELSCKFKSYTFKSFDKTIGGISRTGLILISNIEHVLNDLGHNLLPDGLDGKADDLLEIYVNECLQYLFYAPGRRYGSDRLFESVPDGVILGKFQSVVLYDAKAYKEGFKIEADDILRFSKYIKDFNDKYGNYLGAVFKFVIVSGHFLDSDESLLHRSEQLYANCNTSLSIIKAIELGEMVKIIRNNYDIRESINWKNILTNHNSVLNNLKVDINRIRKDNLI